MSKTKKFLRSFFKVVCGIFTFAWLFYAFFNEAGNSVSRTFGIIMGAINAVIFAILVRAPKTVSENKSVSVVSKETGEEKRDWLAYYDEQLEKYKHYSEDEINEELKNEVSDYLIDDDDLIILKPGEHLLFESFTAFSYNTKNVIVGRETESNGVSIRIMDGMYYRSGTSISKNTREDIAESKSGTFYVTSKRVALAAEKWGFDLDVLKLSSVEYGENYITFYKNGKAYTVGFGIMPKETVYQIRNLLYLLLHGDLSNYYKKQLGCVEELEPIKADSSKDKVLDTAAELRKFKALLDDGIITEDEFNRKKEQLLNL